MFHHWVGTNWLENSTGHMKLKGSVTLTDWSQVVAPFTAVYTQCIPYFLFLIFSLRVLVILPHPIPCSWSEMGSCKAAGLSVFLCLPLSRGDPLRANKFFLTMDLVKQQRDNSGCLEAGSCWAQALSSFLRADFLGWADYQLQRPAVLLPLIEPHPGPGTSLLFNVSNSDKTRLSFYGCSGF